MLLKSEHTNLLQSYPDRDKVELLSDNSLIEFHKAIKFNNDNLNSLQKSNAIRYIPIVEDEITKRQEIIKGGKKAFLGEIRSWNDKKYRKEKEGHWIEVSEHGKSHHEHKEAGEHDKASNVNDKKHRTWYMVENQEGKELNNKENDSEDKGKQIEEIKRRIKVVKEERDRLFTKHTKQSPSQRESNNHYEEEGIKFHKQLNKLEKELEELESSQDNKNQEQHLKHTREDNSNKIEEYIDNFKEDLKEDLFNGGGEMYEEGMSEDDFINNLKDSFLDIGIDNLMEDADEDIPRGINKKLLINAGEDIVREYAKNYIKEMKE